LDRRDPAFDERKAEVIEVYAAAEMVRAPPETQRPRRRRKRNEFAKYAITESAPSRHCPATQKRPRQVIDISSRCPDGNSVLLADSSRIAETLKKVEAAGFEEVILYFNVGLKPHAQVKDEMARFMEEIAAVFDGKHNDRSAA